MDGISFMLNFSARSPLPCASCWVACERWGRKKFRGGLRFGSGDVVWSGFDENNGEVDVGCLSVMRNMQSDWRGK